MQHCPSDQEQVDQIIRNLNADFVKIRHCDSDAMKTVVNRHSAIDSHSRMQLLFVPSTFCPRLFISIFQSLQSSNHVGTGLALIAGAYIYGPI